MFAIDELVADLAGIACATDPVTIRRKSRDWYSISPLLRKSLEGKLADVIVTPRSKDDVLRVMAAAAKRRIPIPARGASTANYGQSVPLHGGIVLDMTGLTGVLWVRPGEVRAYSGALMSTIDEETRKSPW